MSGDVVLCCEPVLDEDFNQGNSIFMFNKVNNASKIWRKASNLDIRGGGDEAIILAEIRRMETKEVKAKVHHESFVF